RAHERIFGYLISDFGFVERLGPGCSAKSEIRNPKSAIRNGFLMAQRRLIRVAQFTMLAVFLAGLGWASYSLVHYLRTAPSFEVGKLSVSGIRRVDENQVLAKAGL